MCVCVCVCVEWDGMIGIQEAQKCTHIELVSLYTMQDRLKNPHCKNRTVVITCPWSPQLHLGASSTKNVHTSTAYFIILATQSLLKYKKCPLNLEVFKKL